MGISIQTSVDEAIAELERKAARVQESENLDRRVQDAKEGFVEVESRFSAVEDSAKELSFYVQVYEQVFDEERPERLELTLSTVERNVSLSDEELLSIAENSEFVALSGRLSDAADELDGECEQMKDEIVAQYEDGWEDDLRSARELNRIIDGDGGEFSRIIRDIELFLTRDVRDTSKNPRSLASEWKTLKQRWEQNVGKQGWEEFREEHGLSESTVEDLKKFTSDKTVRISDLSMTTLKEIKTVDELESALEVRLRS